MSEIVCMGEMIKIKILHHIPSVFIYRFFLFLLWTSLVTPRLFPLGSLDAFTDLQSFAASGSELVSPLYKSPSISCNILMIASAIALLRPARRRRQHTTWSKATNGIRAEFECVQRASAFEKYLVARNTQPAVVLLQCALCRLRYHKSILIISHFHRNRKCMANNK